MSGVAGTYSYVYSYKADGSPATKRMPGIGGLSAETVTYGYNDNGLPATLGTNLSSTGSNTYYVNGTSYTRYGEVGTLSMRYDSGKVVNTGAYYETGTRRLNRLLTTGEGLTAPVADVSYTWDASGNVTRASDAATSDTQCFGYDYLRRLSEAWTPANADCATAPTQSGLGGPAPYWQSFAYDKVGNRRTSTDRTITSSVTRTYNYPAPTAAQPHALSTVTTGSTTTNYSYDPAGNTQTRPSANGTQTLTWDAEGRIATSADNSGTTSYLYDTQGNRLVRSDPSGKTLYLPDQEVRFTSGTSTVKGTRYYEFAGQTVAMREGTNVTWLVNDRQGTAQASINAATMAVTVRRQKPFGEARGTSASWPNDKGFVGGTNDNTGLVHLGAREYDPGLGRFVSVDPVIEPDDPQQLNGYAYANNSPVTFSDADGRFCVWCFVAAVVQAVVRAIVRYYSSSYSSSSGGHRRPSAGSSVGRAGGHWAPHVRFERGTPTPAPAPNPSPRPAPLPTPAPSPGPSPTPPACPSCPTNLDRLIDLILQLAAKVVHAVHKAAVAIGHVIAAGANAVGKAVWDATWLGEQAKVALESKLMFSKKDRANQAERIGNVVEAEAVAHGATCWTQQDLRICRGWDALTKRGGTTYGTVYLDKGTGRVTDERIRHEKAHVRQWREFGGAFATMYTYELIRTLGDPCTNVYEIQAGLKDGYPDEC